MRKSALTFLAEESISRISETNGVCCMNYHSDMDFMTDSTLFKDAQHLNERCARKFTRVICD